MKSMLLMELTTKKIKAYFLGIVVVIVVLACQLGSAQTPDYTPLKDHISTLIEQKMLEYALTGVSIALVDEQDIVWSQGFGYADQEAGLPATEKTVYRVGSISKLFTALAIMQLYDQGKLDLDQPVSTYIPEFSIMSRFPASEPITIRSILTHRSGITRDTSYPLMRPLKNGKTFRDVIPILQHSYLLYPPNTRYTYSNAAIDVLGVVIERVSGMAFDDYVTTHILEPLTMLSSTFSLPDPLNPLLSKHYRNNMMVINVFTKIMPHGSFSSSVVDLAHFMVMTLQEGLFAQRRLLQPDTLHTLLQLQHEQLPGDIGLPEEIPWFLAPGGPIHTVKTDTHLRGLVINRSALLLLPKQQLGVVALTNSDTDLPLIRDIAVETIKCALEIKTGIKTLEKPPAQIITLSEAEKQKYAGLYATELGLLSITMRDQQLQIKLSDSWYPLIPYDDGYLAIQEKNMRLTLNTIHEREMLVIEQTDRIVTGERYPQQALSPAWLKRAGLYKIADSRQLTKAQIYALTIETIEGILVLNTVGTKLVLDPISENEAVVLGGDTFGFFNRTLRFEKVDDREILLLDDISYKRVSK